jgi:hypothetical protein
MLVILGVWRRVFHAVSVRYDPLCWARCFRSGCTGLHPFARPGDRCAVLLPIPRVFVFIALAAWA